MVAQEPITKPYSTGILIAGIIHDFYTDFIIGVNDRRTEHGIILIDTKERINDQEGQAVVKVKASNPAYGKAIIIYLKKEKNEDDT